MEGKSWLGFLDRKIKYCETGVISSKTLPSQQHTAVGLDQGWRTPVLESRRPAEYSYNPN